MIAIFVAVSSFLLASSSISQLDTLSVWLRVAGAAVVVLPAVWRRRLVQRASLTSVSRAMVAVGCGLIVYLTASSLLHGRFGPFLLGVATVVLIGTIVQALISYYSVRQLVGGAYAAFLSVCLVSIILGAALPAIAIENGRLRGLIENANGLGFVAFLLAVLSLSAVRRRVPAVVGLVVAVYCLFATASRASLLAVLVMSLGLAIGRVARARFWIGFGALAVGLAWVLVPGGLAGAALFRDTDSRSSGLDYVHVALADSFWTGAGALPTDSMVAGSVFAAGITGGALGIVGLMIMYVSFLVGFARYRPRALSLVLAGVVHSLFESWMLSFSGPMLLTFIVTLIACLKRDVVGTTDLTSILSVPRARAGGRDVRNDLGTTR